MFKTVRRIGKAVCIIGIIFVAVMCIEPIRLKVMNFIAGSGIMDKGFDCPYTLEYIPEGFERVQKYRTDSMYFFSFEKGEHYFDIYIKDFKMSSSVDTKSKEIKNIEINGKGGKYIISEKFDSVLWHDTKNSFSLYGNLSEAELIKIAENIKKL